MFEKPLLQFGYLHSLTDKPAFFLNFSSSFFCLLFLGTSQNSKSIFAIVFGISTTSLNTLTYSMWLLEDFQ